MSEPCPDNRLNFRDYLLLGAFCLLFFGLSLVGGRPLTMHEGVLPQTAREMFNDQDWVVPKNGGRPWLESPPLPQWITVGIAGLCGRCDEVWIVRIGPAIMGTIAVLLVAWMAAGWFGRTIGLLAGFIFATMYELAQYAWLAEDEIFLCALVTAAVAFFVKIEFFNGDSASEGSRHFFGKRPWSLLAFFFVLGMTNLAKGLMFGTVMALVPMAGFLLWNADWRRISYYLWFPGWLAFAAVAVAWPLAAWMRFHDVTDLWFFDHVGRLDGEYRELTKPIWYYLKVLPGEIAPWTIVVPFGLWLSRTKALRERYSPERFLWCWAILTPLVFSIPTGKNHHYLLHCIAPWAVLAAPALVWMWEQLQSLPARMRNPFYSLLTIALPGIVALWILRDKIVGPTWLVPALIAALPFVTVGFSWAVAHSNGRVAATGLFGFVTAAFCAGHIYAGAYVDQCREDTTFLQHVQSFVPAGQQVAINTHMGSLDEFRMQFYLDSRAVPLHNLSFLADDRIHSRSLFVVARAGEQLEIDQYGDSAIVLQSERTRREKTPDDRLTLFYVRLRDDVPRLSSKELRISPMQTAGRAEGPILGTHR